MCASDSPVNERPRITTKQPTAPPTALITTTCTSARCISPSRNGSIAWSISEITGRLASGVHVGVDAGAGIHDLDEPGVVVDDEQRSAKVRRRTSGVKASSTGP